MFWMVSAATTRSYTVGVASSPLVVPSLPFAPPPLPDPAGSLLRGSLLPSAGVLSVAPPTLRHLFSGAIRFCSWLKVGWLVNGRRRRRLRDVVPPRNFFASGRCLKGLPHSRSLPGVWVEVSIAA